MRLVLAPARAEIVERGSRFLALAHPAASIERALAVRDAERSIHHDASHHVFAVRADAAAFRYDDDGEPSGSGGRPVLAELEAGGFVETVVVVTRWFGGTRLGTGGLARAYGSAAAAALASAPAKDVVPGEVRHVRYGFEDTGAVARTLAATGAVRGADSYPAGVYSHDSGVRTEVRIPRGSGAGLDRRLRDATAGRAGLEPNEEPPTCWIASTT